MFSIILTKQADKDREKILKSSFKHKLYEFLEVIENDPFVPPYEKLSGYANVYSRRINKQHRLVYEVLEHEIKILSMWSHYESL